LKNFLQIEFYILLLIYFAIYQFTLGIF